LPRHVLVGYWHNFTNPSGPAFPLSQVSNTWDVIVVAFAANAGGGNVSFVPDPAAGNFAADVAAKRAAGKKVILSLGGQDGSVSLNNATETANFVNSLGNIIAQYGFDGIDIDLESGTGVTHGSPVLANMVSAVKQLRARFGSSFYLSMAPEHPYVHGAHIAYSGIWGAYLPIIDGLRNELNLLHVQLYNNGGLQTPYAPSPYAAGTVDMLVASAKMLIEGFPRADGGTFAPLRADQVALGLPSGPSSAGSGQASNANIMAALDCITRGTACGSVRMNANQPTFRGVMTWSINWDRFDGFIFSGPIGNKVHTLP
jgi:chitinase